MIQTSYSDLRGHLASYLDTVTDDVETVVVRRRGKADVALIAADELRSLQETVHLFRSTANAKHLIAAFEQTDRGEGVTMTMDELRALAERHGLRRDTSGASAAGA
ncbi:MAG TPA: type II toxin-antitoxin system prevent-host-death family antitoxin [Kofleriaceae bacterium]|nr:type II toxin-antitoxin system prevent-host-death family antitoxin [Kofleriaceae bacterium]